jgi:predicted AAA+ superfamily ATPase
MIRSGARAYVYETPLQWLCTAGIVTRCEKTREGRTPLSASAEPGAFKLYMMDTGLLCSKFGVAANVILSGERVFDSFKGALTENAVCQALAANGFTPWYWESGGKAEVDFILQDRRGNVIPLEVKSFTHVRSKSLVRFVELYKPPYAIRVSAKNFGFENGVRSIPLYGLFCFKP